MFERFTERSRQVVVLAQDEARALKHNYIGTEHLLLGLLRMEDGLAARVLASFDVTVDEVRDRVALIVGPGDEVTPSQIPFTPRAKKVLELALREALSLGHNYIGTEHILLGVVRENEGVAARILLDFDLDAQLIRDRIIRMLSREQPSRPGAGALRITPRASPTWEFHVERWPAGDAEAREAQLADLGAKGWQLAAVVADGEAAQWVFQRPGRSRPHRSKPTWTTALIGEGTYRPATVADIENAAAAARRDAEQEGDSRRVAVLTEFEALLDGLLERITEALKGTMEVGGDTVLDELVEAVREAKEQAIEARDFERAASVRDLQRRLVAQLERIAVVLKRRPGPP